MKEHYGGAVTFNGCIDIYHGMISGNRHFSMSLMLASSRTNNRWVLIYNGTYLVGDYNKQIKNNDVVDVFYESDDFFDSLVKKADNLYSTMLMVDQRIPNKVGSFKESVITEMCGQKSIDRMIASKMARKISSTNIRVPFVREVTFTLMPQRKGFEINLEAPHDAKRRLEQLVKMI